SLRRSARCSTTGECFLEGARWAPLPTQRGTQPVGAHSVRPPTETMMEPNDLRAAIEAILFISNEPVRTEELAEAFADDGGLDAVIAQIEEIKRILDANVGGFMLEQAGGGWRFASRAEHEPTLKKYFDRKGQNRLSIAALETLAIVAYRQPIGSEEHTSELQSL